MTLQSSGQISIADIAAELGISSSGLSLDDSRCRALAGKPSGQIAMSDFYGKSAAAGGTLMSSPAVASGLAIPGASTFGELTFNTDGTITYNGSDVESGPANWVAGGSGLWYMRVTATNGAFSTSPGTGVWLPMNNNRLFRKGPATAGAGQCIFTIEWSPNGGSSISATIAGNKVSYAHGDL